MLELEHRFTTKRGLEDNNMAKFVWSIIVLGVIVAHTQAEPVVHTLRIRFSEPVSSKIILPKPEKQQAAPYPAAGYRPEPQFELPSNEPEVVYLPPEEPELVYEPPEEIYGPPEPEITYGTPAETYGPPPDAPAASYAPPDLTYGPPDQTYGPPDITYGLPDSFEPINAAIVNAPLQLASPFTPPRPNKPVSFRPNTIKFPQSAAIINTPLRPISYLTVPRPERIIAFRPRRFQAQQLFPSTQLTLPRVERLIAFRPRRIPTQSNKFNRPLPANIFGSPNKGRSPGRPLSSNIFP